MKVYKNQTLQSAKELGFHANFAFASDPIMSPKGIDVMPLKKDNTLVHYEVTKFDKDTHTARISIMNEKEYNEFIKQQ